MFDAAAGGGWTVIKNWDFGTDAGNTVKTSADLVSEFEFHDNFGQINNGNGNYGCDMVAEPGAPAFGAQLRASGFRTFAPGHLKMHVREIPKAGDMDHTTIGPASKHDCGYGGLMAKFSQPTAGRRYGKDIIVETRFRIETPCAVGYWLAPAWVVGSSWDRGPEIDPLESFPSDGGNLCGKSWHSDAVYGNTTAGSNAVNYSNWWPGMASTGLTEAQRYLTDWHTLTLVYRKDNTFEVFFDGHRAQHGTLDWTTAAAPDPEHVRMHHLWDGGFGHTGIAPLNAMKAAIPADGNVITYNVDYWRIGEK
jgi:hypothetical protein